MRIIMHIIIIEHIMARAARRAAGAGRTTVRVLIDDMPGSMPGSRPVSKGLFTFRDRERVKRALNCEFPGA
ncbi:hypothetical protein GCM10009592_06740 [Brachybacterium rhamnosum]|uniref:Uncharacterized protein n=1 Tax=Brachybacterium rhamnosum TaxID=173361 RepID=A0ABW4PTW5_9MICO